MATERIENEFGPSTIAPRGPSAMVAVAQQREIAEVQTKMMLARANPRDEKAALDRILQACTRPTLAESALYSYSRGGADVSGPSIRLAEVLAQNWGNFDFGIRELEQRDGESTVEAYAWDIQNNVSQRKIFQVPHIRYSRNKGNTLLTDPRDIYEMVANQGARRLRACILGVIPGDVIEAASKQCDVTMNARVKITPELIQSLIEKFAEFKVTKEMIEKRIQRRLESIPPALVVQLGKIYNSLKDGMSKPDEWFGNEKPEAEKGAIDIADIKAGKEENRGHGNENLDQVGKTQQEAGTKAPAPASESKSRQASRSRANPPAAAPQSAGNPNYVEGSDPDPFAQNGELFGSREPGQEG
jgi:hypothetical protein